MLVGFTPGWHRLPPIYIGRDGTFPILESGGLHSICKVPPTARGESAGPLTGFQAEQSKAHPPSVNRYGEKSWDYLTGPIQGPLPRPVPRPPQSPFLDRPVAQRFDPGGDHGAFPSCHSPSSPSPWLE